MNSDKIVVIADGEIEESGTHVELLAADGIYANLCEGQGLTADAAKKSEYANDAEAGASQAVSSSAVISGADDVEKGGSNNEIKEESKEEKYNYKDINSRLRQFTKADLLYSVAGYSGGILIGALPGKDKYILS